MASFRRLQSTAIVSRRVSTAGIQRIGRASRFSSTKWHTSLLFSLRKSEETGHYGSEGTQGGQPSPPESHPANGIFFQRFSANVVTYYHITNNLS